MTLSEIAVGCCLVMAGSPAPPTVPLEQAWVYMSEIAWREPPREVEKTYLEGDGQIVVLYPRGGFARLSVTLFEDRVSRAVSICAGCGYSLKRGEWDRTDRGTLLVTAKWVHRELPPMDKSRIHRAEITEWEYSSGEEGEGIESLSHEQVVYFRLRDLANPELLEQLLASKNDDE